MNWKVILTVGALSILPLSVNAAETYQIDRGQENNMEQSVRMARRGRKGDRGQRMERLLQQLDLTSEQSTQIEAIKERSQTAMADLKEQLKTQRQAMQSLLANDASVEEIREQHQITQSLHQQLDNNRFETMLEIREVLTAEQRTKMAELLESRRGEKPDSQS